MGGCLCGGKAAFGVALVFLGLDQLVLASGPAFPRGPGFYYHPFKLALLLVVYFGWMAACGWIDRDARKLGRGPLSATALMILVGAVGLTILWLLPLFWLGLLLDVALVGGATFLYIAYRDQRVEPAERVMTNDFMRELANRCLRFPSAGDHKDKPGVPVRFLSRGEDAGEAADDGVRRARESTGYKAAMKLVYEAVQKRATDIHLEPTKTDMAVRLRVDGILEATLPFTRATGDAVVNVFKVLGNLDIAEKRKPQDGSFSAQVADGHVDFRVATAGSITGEKLVMRVLDKSHQVSDLSQLGMRDKMRTQVREVVAQPHGLFLVSGPTGAGKTTTLYACLNEIDRFQQNVITLENPVEYQLANVTQIEINERAGKTFASELRSVLRQDPDVILIGEIRDQETAVIACQAAQTGHMVFSTVHANDTATAIGRLLDLGVPPFLLAGALTGVLGQRLVRQLCPNCKVRYKPDPELLRKANLPVDKIKFFYRPPSPRELDDSETEGPCATCGGSGYFKRSGIFELLLVNDKVRELIRAKRNLAQLRHEAVMAGMRYLYEDGLRKVLEGETSIQELLRVSK
jgi:type II secretory ATPase GspE/PulE/Tfp pilus assembly ATPase PilB-like protein